MTMTLLPFLFVSLTVFCSTLVGCGALASTLRAYHEPLVQISSFLGPPSAEADAKSLGRFLRHHHMVRLLLQQPEEECGPDFVQYRSEYLDNVLGPASSSDSLFQNIKFPNNETLDLTDLFWCWLFPTYIYPSEPTFVQEEQVFGRNGELTNVLLQQHEHLIDFWNATHDPPILLVGFHAEPLKDLLPETVQACYIESGYDSELLTEDALNEVVEDVRTAIEEELPGNYSNPALTFEAAQYTPSDLSVTGFEDSVVISIGDGVLDWVTSLGLPQEVGGPMLHAALLSFAVQFLLDLEENNGNLTEYWESMASPGAFRKGNLEALAMAGYALAHDQGGNWSFDMLRQAGSFAHNNGDCDVDGMWHAGTPSQNECANLWGADEGFHAKGSPFSVKNFRKLFQENLDQILALDPSVCTLSESSTPTNTTSGQGSRTGPMTAFVMVMLSFLLL